MCFPCTSINYLIGVWLACEDIHPDSGPLVYYPGSHKEPLYPKFDNYPQTNLRTCAPSETTAYYDWLKKRSKNYKKDQFIARKGDILLWHGQLIHGGDAVVNPSLTHMESYVCHYIPAERNMPSGYRTFQLVDFFTTVFNRSLILLLNISGEQSFLTLELAFSRMLAHILSSV